MSLWRPTIGRRRLAALSAGTWEEDGSGEIRGASDRLAGDEGDLAARNAEIVELPVGQAAQLVDRLTVAAPVAEVADQVHFSTHLSSLRLRGAFVRIL